MITNRVIKLDKILHELSTLGKYSDKMNEINYEDDTLQIWSGLGQPDDYAFEVKIKSKNHLAQLLISLGLCDD